MPTYNFMNEQVTTDANFNPVSTAPITSSTMNSSGSLSNVVTGASTPYTPTVIQPAQTTGATNLNLPQPDPTTSLLQANGMVAGADQTAKTLQDWIKKNETAPTDLDIKNQGFIDSLSKLYGQDVGKAQALDTAEKNAGVPQMQQQLQEINNSILTKNAEYAKISTNINGEAIPMELIRGQQAQLARTQASEIGLLTARAQATQGNITLAMATAKKAVDLQFAAIEEQIVAQERQLALIQPLLNTQERKIAEARAMMLEDQKYNVAIQKDNVMQLQEMAIQAAAGGAPQSIVQQAIATNDPVKAASILSQYLKGPTESLSSGGGGSTSQESLFRVPTAKELEGAQFYKFSGPQVYTSNGTPINLEQYKQLTGQTGVEDSAVNFSGIKTMGATAPTSTAPRTGTGTGTGTKYTISSASQEVKDTWAQGYIQGNGKISSTDYKAGKAWWISQGLSATSFDTTFSYLIDQSSGTWKVDYGYKGN